MTATNLYARGFGRPASVGTDKPNRFLAALPADDYDRLAPHMLSVTMGRGTVLHDDAGPIEHVYFPHSGMASLVALMGCGATIATMSVGRSGAIGYIAAMGDRQAVGRAVVQIPGTASRIPASSFRAAARASEAIRELVVLYNDLQLARIQQSVACAVLHSLDQRLCRWLLQAHDCSDGNDLPLTQELLGEMLGVRRTSVTSAARTMQSAGMITYRRGHIHVVNRSALEEAACECYATVRETIDRTFSVRTNRSVRPVGCPAGVQVDA